MYELEVPDRVAQYTTFTAEINLVTASPEGRSYARAIYVDDVSAGTVLAVTMADGTDVTLTVGSAREVLGKFTAILAATTVSRLTVSW